MTDDTSPALRPEHVKVLRYLRENHQACANEVRVLTGSPCGTLADLHVAGLAVRSDLPGGGSIWKLTDAGRRLAGCDGA